MSKLFACMCNQPQRLAAALAPVRHTLVAAPPLSRWGLGYIQGGDVLLVRTPKASAEPVDLAAPLADIATDCAIAQSVRDDGYAGTDNTPPFRFRRWLYAQSGPYLGREDAGIELAGRLVEHIPEYLRRNIKGRTPAELIFHVFLSMLHDEGSLDDPNLPTAATRRALAATLRLVGNELDAIGGAHQLGTISLTNGRSMVAMRLDEVIRLRRLTVVNERGEQERGADAFRGVLLVAGGDGDPREGFEDVPPRHAVLISRDLQVSFADLAN